MVIRFIKGKFKYLILYAMLALLVGFLLYEKTGYHKDEMLTYTLANGQGFAVEDGAEYDPSNGPFIEAVASKGLDFANVWRQQRADTHPPLYYALVHTICSVFTGKFSRLFAGAVNIVFILLTFHMYRKIVDLFVEDKSFSYIISIAFVLSAGILSISTYLRMYVMAMFFVTAICFFAIISKSAPYELDRYISPVYAIFLGGGCSLAYLILSHFIDFPKTVIMIYSVITAIVIYSGFAICDWPYLYNGEKDLVVYAGQNGADTEAVVIYDKPWNVPPQYLSISRCDSAVFYNVTSYDEFEDKINSIRMGDKGVALYIITESHDIQFEEYANCFLNAHPEYRLTYSKVLSNGEGETFWLR